MKGIRVFLVALFALGLVFSATELDRTAKVSKAYVPKMERTEQTVFTGTGNTSPIHYYNDRNSVNVELADSSKNGYGLVVSMTNPLAVTEWGWIIAYRQWAGADGTSGQVGAAYSSDGTNWTTYTNLNPGLGAARYPSAVATEYYPYAFWNEYTGLGTGYGGRPYYSYDEFEWDGGSFSEPYDVDLVWNDSKDLWVGCPVYNYDEANDMNHFNVSYSDWTRNDLYLFHSEAYEDGYIIFSDESIIIDVNNDLVGGDADGRYNSDPILDINNDGIGYFASAAYFDGANQTPPISPYANVHTVIFAMTDDYGESWSGGQGGSDYYYIPDEVFDHMMGPNYPEGNEFPNQYVDDCDGSVIDFERLFCTYDFDLKVDDDGNPHIVIGVLPSAADGVYPGMPYNGLYHFWIDKEYLMNPGAPQTATGWNYSRMLDTGNMWRWENADGESYWQGVFPSLSLSTENSDVLWVSYSGPAQGEFVVTDDGGTPDDECDDLGSFPTWNEEVFVLKSVDGGATWWCPFNATQTDPDCWIDPQGEYQCADEEICPDGETLDEPSEVDAHTGLGATDDMVPIVWQTPDWCGGSTTGDMSAQNHKTRLWVGWIELTSEDMGECLGDCTPGDVNLDEAIDILDIVAILNHILYAAPLAGGDCAGDYNGDGGIDILDIVGIVNYILFGRGDDATVMNVLQTENGVDISADGFVGAVEMTIKHNGNFSLELADGSLAGAHKTDGNITTLIVVAPVQGSLFTSAEEFEIDSVVAASGESYIGVNIVEEYALLSNYPNPFNPETTLEYDLRASGTVELTIYNLMGQQIANLVNEHQRMGTYTINWAGLDNAGNPVGSGVYLAQLNTSNEVVTHKITLLR